jgi:phenylalanyl-tRNA synthetase beta chain
VASIFSRLGLDARREGSGGEETFTVVPPSFRFDLEIEEDLIEEVARVYGFDRIPVRAPLAPAVMRSQPETRRSLHALRDLLADADYQEVVNFSFVDDAWEKDFGGRTDAIRVANPIASQLSVMRSTLIGGLVANARYNVNRRLDRVRAFEIGRVYLPDPSVPDGALEVAGIAQPVRVAALALGPALEEQWGAQTRPVDFFDVKADLEMLVAPRRARFEAAAHPAFHPGRSARVLIEGRPAGWLGELHPAWQQRYELPAAPILFELDAEGLLDVPLPRHADVSKFPPITRDRAVTVPENVPVQALLDAMEEARPAAVQEIRMFDLYRGKGVEPGRKSLAFRVVMQDTAKTLTDVEADAAMAKLTAVLTSRFDAKVRA